MDDKPAMEITDAKKEENPEGDDDLDNKVVPGGF